MLGEGTVTKKTAAEYPVQATLPSVSIGAEYLVRSVSGRSQTFFIPDYLVVEVAVFPSPGQSLAISSRHFSLRVNGSKGALSPQSPGFVAAALKYPDWERRRTVEAIAGTGSGGVILGRPPATERFPGDPMPGRTRLPPPPRAPEPENRSGVEKEPVRAEDVIAESVLPERETSLPISGYLYFPFKGKTKSIRSLELLYQGPAGNAPLRLR